MSPSVLVDDAELDTWNEYVTGHRPKWPPDEDTPRELSSIIAKALSKNTKTDIELKEKIIRHEGDKWILYTRDGKRRLGEFDTEKEALARERQIQYFVHRRKISEEGETRGENAQAQWAASWYKSYPPSGRGRWIYQHHWRGLSDEETKLDDNELMKTDHSIHGDLRFSGPVQLWGVSVFLGRASDNTPNERMLDALSPQKPLQVAFKLPQPKDWLEVGRGKPYVAEPGEAGSTTQTNAKFFAMDYGSYDVGVFREHLFEVFLHGSKLKGRYLIEYAPIGGRRVWLIVKPEDQTPYAEKNDVEDIKAELKKKGQKHLIWAKPGERPRRIEI